MRAAPLALECHLERSSEGDLKALAFESAQVVVITHGHSWDICRRLPSERACEDDGSGGGIFGKKSSESPVAPPSLHAIIKP